MVWTPRWWQWKRKLQEALIWPAMKRHIQEFHKKCPACIVMTKRPSNAPMGGMPIAHFPEFVVCDLIGPLIKSPDGNQYIMTVLDHCTGWAEAYAIPDKTGKAVWQVLSWYYIPHLQTIGVEHRRTTPYNPQTNGKCECFNGVLKSIIT
jgi:hypothetical protein